MAGKSGRSISATPQNAFKSSVLSWEGFLVVLFIAVNIFCVFLSPNYKVTNVLREMPKYLAEVFIMFPMAYILIMGEIDISVGSIVCLSATLTCLASNAGGTIRTCNYPLHHNWNRMRIYQWSGEDEFPGTAYYDHYPGYTDHLPRYR